MVCCPDDYGPSTTVCNRFNRWSQRGFWLKLLDALAGTDAVTKSTAIFPLVRFDDASMQA